MIKSRESVQCAIFFYTFATSNPAFDLTCSQNNKSVQTTLYFGHGQSSSCSIISLAACACCAPKEMCIRDRLCGALFYGDGHAAVCAQVDRSERNRSRSIKRFEENYHYKIISGRYSNHKKFYNIQINLHEGWALSWNSIMAS